MIEHSILATANLDFLFVLFQSATLPMNSRSNEFDARKSYLRQMTTPVLEVRSAYRLSNARLIMSRYRKTISQCLHIYIRFRALPRICSFIADVVFVFHIKACTCLDVYCQEKGKRRCEQIHQHPEDILLLE